MSGKEGETKKSETLSKTDDGLAKTLQSLAKPAILFITRVLPIIIQYVSKAVELYNKLPQNMINFIIGIIYCFFGGLYPTLFAAIQAAEHGGRETVVKAIREISEEAMGVIEESKKDDKVDDDDDGIADVLQISNEQYAARKTLLVLRKINPERVEKAVSGMYTVWLSIAAVLSIQFARTISLALSVANFLNKPCDRYISPLLQDAIPREYGRWIPVILHLITKCIAMSIAWYIQSVLSAFSSALTGGLMIGKAFHLFCLRRGYNPLGLIGESDKDSFLDEGLAYIFAALGFYFQFSLGFDVSFPFNLVLFPFEMAEFYIRWMITS